MGRYQAADLLRKPRSRRITGDHQHRLAAHRVPQAVSGIVVVGKFNHPAAYGKAHRKHLPPDTVGRRGPEHHRQYQIRGGGGNEEHPEADVRIEDAVYRRDPASRKKPQGQHTARKTAGKGKKQHRQPCQSFLPAEGYQGQKHP